MHTSLYMSMIFYALTMILRALFTTVDKYFKLKPNSIGDPYMFLEPKYSQ